MIFYPSVVHFLSGNWYIFTPAFTRKGKEGYGRWGISDGQAGRVWTSRAPEGTSGAPGGAPRLVLEISLATVRPALLGPKT